MECTLSFRMGLAQAKMGSTQKVQLYCMLAGEIGKHGSQTALFQLEKLHIKYQCGIGWNSVEVKETGQTYH